MQLKPKVVLVSLFCAVLTILHAQNVAFKIQYSEPLAVFEFVNSITSRSSNSPLKNRFDSSGFNNSKYKLLISKFENLNYMYWYEYPQYPYGSKIGGCTYFLLAKNLIESKTIDEFETKSIGIIPSSDLRELSSVLTEFVPVYNELIYSPCKAVFEKQIEEIRTKLQKTDIGLLISRTKYFQNSDWSTKQPFALNLFPTPPGPNIHATAFFNYALCNLPTDHKDIDLIVSFMFHEAFHIIFDEQSLKFKQDLNKWYAENPSKWSKYAELLFNESLTTALSSGYLYPLLKGAEMERSKWYNTKSIASTAQKLYPILINYINQNKQMDRDFINEYIKAYDASPMEWKLDRDNILGDRYIISDDEKLRRKFGKIYRYRSIDENASGITLLNLEKIKATPITKVIIISKDNQNKIALIKESFEELKKWDLDPGKDFIQCAFLKDKTYLLIVNSASEEFETQITKVKFE